MTGKRFAPLVVDGDAEREIAGAALHGPTLADLQNQTVQEHDRVDVV
jgi:hypothetical protein